MKHFFSYRQSVLLAFIATSSIVSADSLNKQVIDSNTLAIIESIAKVPAFTSSAKIITDLNLDQIYDWHETINKLTSELKSDLNNLDIHFKQNPDKYPFWQIQRDNILQRLDVTTINNVNTIFKIPSQFGMAHHLIDFHATDTERTITIDKFPSIEQTHIVLPTNNTILIRSVFSRKYENSTDIKSRIIALRATLDGHKIIQKLAPISLAIINVTTQSYTQISSDISELAQLFATALQAPLVESTKLIPLLQTLPIVHKIFNNFKTNVSDHLYEEILKICTFTYSKTESTIFIHMMIPLIDNPIHLTLKELSPLSIKLPKNDFIFNQASFYYLHDESNDIYYTATRTLRDQCTRLETVADCIMNYNQLQQIPQTACLREIINTTLPFSNCQTTYNVSSNQSSKTIGSQKQWTFTQQKDHIWFANTIKNSFSRNFDTITISNQQLMIMHEFSLRSSLHYKVIFIILAILFSLAVGIGLTISWFSVRKQIDITDNNSWSEPYVPQPRLDSIYEDIAFAFNPPFGQSRESLNISVPTPTRPKIPPLPKQNSAENQPEYAKIKHPSSPSQKLNKYQSTYDKPKSPPKSVRSLDDHLPAYDKPKSPPTLVKATNDNQNTYDKPNHPPTPIQSSKNDHYQN